MAMGQFFCYTTAFNAIELFSLCRSAKERQAVENVMHSMKILGLNGKSAKNVGSFFSTMHGKPLSTVELLIAGVCMESRLPILTGRPRRYRRVHSLRVIPASDVIASYQKGIVWF